MKIRPKKFDIGEIISQCAVQVPEDVLMPDLYKQLADVGAATLVSSIRELPQCLEKARMQPDVGVTYGKYYVLCDIVLLKIPMLATLKY